MTNQTEQDWIDNYGFILVAYAHMTDWWLADSEMKVIHDKMAFILSNTKQPFNNEGVAQKMVEIIDRYQAISEDDEKMDALLNACLSLKNEPWFDNLAATVLLNYLAEIAEADRKIEKTEKQFLKNIAGVFEVSPPRI